MKKEYSTKSKNMILDYVKNTMGKQFCAADIQEYLQKERCEVNLVTVYRNLDKLSEEGVLMRYKYADKNFCMYQYTGEAEECCNHLHMKCSKCGKLYHLECDFMEDINRHLMEHHGFLVDCKGSVLTGTCKECRK